ncbi:lipopolysaccharide biosynthesis protein [Ferrimonas kyonanensis]|uniref:lipopolysaccharide biosynthesis protein n=1 Tax=Ferrimonas kyonanensis TaxID=364763 RepID=UPI000487A6E6|nr:hypothetical protein [Ferrimonas kyonanensis]
MKTQVIVSTVDQGILSAFNFALNLALIKLWQPAEFGVYSIVFMLSYVLISLQNALINTPYSVLVPASDNPDHLRSTLSLSNGLFLVSLTLICYALLHLPLLQQDFSGNLAITTFFAIRLLREFLRCRWSSELILMPVLVADLLFVVFFLVLMGIWQSQHPLHQFSLEHLLWFLSLSQLLGMVYLLKQEFPLFTLTRWSALPRHYAPIWDQSRWSLVGVITTELQNRGYIFIVGLAFGPTVVGFIQAGRVFFGPLNIITSAWTRIAKPTLAKLHAQGERQQFQTLTNQGALGFLLFNLVFGVLLWLAWPWLQPQLFGDQYAGIGFVVAQWAIATLLFHLRSTYSAAIQAQNRFKPLAMATIWGASLSLGILTILALAQASNWVIFTVIFGEIVAFGYILLLFAPQLQPRWLPERR